MTNQDPIKLLYKAGYKEMIRLKQIIVVDSFESAMDIRIDQKRILPSWYYPAIADIKKTIEGKGRIVTSSGFPILIELLSEEAT